MRLGPECEGDHIGDLADEFDREAVLLRMHDDPVDQTAQDPERLIADGWIGERFVELRDLAAVKACEVRV